MTIRHRWEGSKDGVNSRAGGERDISLFNFSSYMQNNLMLKK